MHNLALWQTLYAREEGAVPIRVAKKLNESETLALTSTARRITFHLFFWKKKTTNLVRPKSETYGKCCRGIAVFGPKTCLTGLQPVVVVQLYLGRI